MFTYKQSSTVISVLFTTICSVGACTEIEDAEPASPEGTAPAPSDLEGTHGTVTVRTRRGGYQTLSYTVHNGHAIYQGDIDLGPVEKLHQRGGAAVLGDRWDSNFISSITG